MALWQTQLEKEARMEAERDITVERPGQDAVLMEELRGLGLLSGVKKTMEEIDSGKIQAWPSLERVAFGSRFHRTTEHELQALMKGMFVYS